ncbi:Rop family plasmid primer RNA-binding protein [Enterobacter sp. Bisph1]|uniref:Rop family plasmid primer RNA-binding protein n=1 Tax=Enterobacter sp. Bisph1 TaxID=1274399 RepID=UPI00057C0194|nr:Rop family plasmid primer RNA-binding protein [Enterobacter sp. Bisph1]
MTKQENTALNMAKFIHEQSLLLLDKLNELNLDMAADMCDQLHEDAEVLCMTLFVQLNDLKDEG